MSVAQYAAATNQTRQNVLYHLGAGNELQGIEHAEKIGSTWVLQRNASRLQRIIKNN